MRKKSFSCDRIIEARLVLGLWHIPPLLSFIIPFFTLIKKKKIYIRTRERWTRPVELVKHLRNPSKNGTQTRTTEDSQKCRVRSRVVQPSYLPHRSLTYLSFFPGLWQILTYLILCSYPKLLTPSWDMTLTFSYGLTNILLSVFCQFLPKNEALWVINVTVVFFTSPSISLSLSFWVYIIKHPWWETEGWECQWREHPQNWDHASEIIQPASTPSRHSSEGPVSIIDAVFHLITQSSLQRHASPERCFHVV